MKQKALWINQIKGLCICLVVIYHSVITISYDKSDTVKPIVDVDGEPLETKQEKRIGFY